MIVETDELDVVPPAGTKSPYQRELKTREALVEELEKGIAGARAALQGTSEEHLMKPWQLKAGGRVVQERPRYGMLRDAINHLAHHRGQLTVYLRLNDVPVPAIYGPSADDQRF